MLGERGRCGPQDVWVTRTRHSPHRSGEPSICRALVHQSLSHRICSHSGLQLRGGKKKIAKVRIGQAPEKARGHWGAEWEAWAWAGRSKDAQPGLTPGRDSRGRA